MKKKTKYTLCGILAVVVLIAVGFAIPFLHSNFKTENAINAQLVNSEKPYMTKESYNPFNHTDYIHLNDKGAKALKDSSSDDIQQAIAGNPIPSANPNLAKKNYLAKLMAKRNKVRKVNPKFKLQLIKPKY